MGQDLFGSAPTRSPRRRFSRALVFVGHAVCPTCAGVVDEERIRQDALLRHGGHGGTTLTVTLHCRCGWSLTIERSEERPPRWPSG